MVVWVFLHTLLVFGKLKCYFSVQVKAVALLTALKNMFLRDRKGHLLLIMGLIWSALLSPLLYPNSKWSILWLSCEDQVPHHNTTLHPPVSSASGQGVIYTVWRKQKKVWVSLGICLISTRNQVIEWQAEAHPWINALKWNGKICLEEKEFSLGTSPNSSPYVTN